MNAYRRPYAAAFVVALGCAALAGATGAASCRAVSGSGTTPLIELYTSEGCDSCPPADRWLSAQFPRAAQPATPIALAFHVDYWDRLGWRDRFASPAWTERQYQAMRANRATFVYTPQLLLQGHDFTSWRRGSAQPAFDEIASRPARADLELSAVVERNAVTATANSRIADPALRKAATIVIAYADSGLTSDVKSGENRGARLTHDHVVRALAQGGRGDSEAKASFALSAEAGVEPTLVAFVQNAADNDVLQAVALSLAGCGR